MRKLARYTQIFLVNVCVLCVLIAALEIAARLLYPEFIGHIHSSTRTMGVRHYFADFKGFRVRAPYDNYVYQSNKRLIVILGDSISNGYGMAFEDIYWVKMQRLMNMDLNSDLQIISLSGYGNNLADAAKAITKFSSEEGISIAGILYQFNFNDVTPYNSESIKTQLDAGAAQGGLSKKFALWRYEYLNYMTILRVAQHYGGIIPRKLSGTCEERGLDALGPYTWTFGSRMYRTESEHYWHEFEVGFSDIAALSERVGARFFVFVSPLVFDVDAGGAHPFYNHIKLDFSCATINPRQRLNSIASKAGVEIIDPSDFLRSTFEARIREGNFTPYFFTADENHFTQTAAAYIAEYLFRHLQSPRVTPGR